MERPFSHILSEEIETYVRTYQSLLRSTGEVRVRAFEEAHIFSDSSLHPGARSHEPDVAAFAYSAARLPAVMPLVRRVVMGQSHEHFESAGFAVRSWEQVRTRGRRRPLRWDGKQTLAAFLTSISDVDDLVPILTAYQIEWNKLHRLLARSALGERLQRAPEVETVAVTLEELEEATNLTTHDAENLLVALGTSPAIGLREIAAHPLDLSVRMLAGSYSQYQRAAQRWWSGVDVGYLREEAPRRRPVYFVSSNMHSLSNLLGGFARAHEEEIVAFARAHNPENLAPRLKEARERGDVHEVANILYYLLRELITRSPDARAKRSEVLAWDAEGGITTLESPGHIDVSAQVIELCKLRPERLDPRVRVPGVERLAESDAVILNIDYPLGVAAYHHLSRLGQGVGEIRGIYVMGKAATLNGRVGDAMISSEVYDEHSRNVYYFQNAFRASDVQPYLREGSVFDNQKALTVRGSFLQNWRYMHTYYREGYTVL
ncbi:MAG TPA: hypothetical protein VKY51_06735 [Fredinandcohnia sp.]|nr:hypothetical protein [Fredinandcohnia sp.]